MAFELITYAVKDRIATITLNRPDKLNALNGRVMEEIRQAFEDVKSNAEVGGVIITGSGEKAFCAGADIDELRRNNVVQGVNTSLRGQAILRGIELCGKPVIAAVNGHCYGGGCELAMSCTLRIASDNAKLGQPEVNLGIIPGYGGTQRLPRLIGVERAAQLIRTGASIGAAEACAWGWAHGAPVADPLAAAKALIADHLAGKVKLAAVNPEPIPVPAKLPAVDLGHRSLAIDAIVCDVMRRGLALPLAEGLALEADGFGRCKATVDMDIGMKNFTQNGPGPRRVPT
jgi:enoyl-CoA hydratase/carnithine racemase